MTIEKLYVQHQDVIWKHCQKVSRSLWFEDIDRIKEIADELFVKAATSYNGSTKFVTHLWHSLRPLYREAAKLFPRKEIQTDEPNFDVYADTRNQRSLIYEEAEKELDYVELKFVAFLLSLDRTIVHDGPISRTIPRMFHEKNPTIGALRSRQIWARVKLWFNSREHCACSIS